MLQFMGLQRVKHDWATELNWLKWPTWWRLFLPERRSQFAHQHLRTDDLWVEGISATLSTLILISNSNPLNIKFLTIQRCQDIVFSQSEFLQGSPWGVATVLWWWDGRNSFLPEIFQDSPAHHHLWLPLVITVTFFGSWHGRKYSTCQWDHRGQKLRLSLN